MANDVPVGATSSDKPVHQSGIPNPIKEADQTSGDLLHEIFEFIKWIASNVGSHPTPPPPNSALRYQSDITPCEPVKVGHLGPGEIGWVYVSDPLGRGVTVSDSPEGAKDGAPNGDAGKDKDQPHVEAVTGPRDVYVHIKVAGPGIPLSDELKRVKRYVKFFGPAPKP
jgi:hypothetical protein